MDERHYTNLKYHHRQSPTSREVKLKVRTTAQEKLPFEAFLTIGNNVMGRVKAVRLPPINVSKYLAKLAPGNFFLGVRMQGTNGKEIKRESMVSYYTEGLGVLVHLFQQKLLCL